MKTMYLIFSLALWSAICLAQSSPSAKSGSKQRATAPPKTAPAQTTPTPPPPGAPAINTAPLISALSALEQSSRQTSVDLARLRIEKWKMDGNSRDQMEANTQSLLKNITNALPGMITASRNAPTSVASTLKLYRDLNVLHDVLSAVAETAGAFGSKEEYQPLAVDTHQLDSLRRSLADYLETLAASQDAEVVSLRGWVQTSAAHAAADPTVTRRIIDENDTEPAKKPVKKKSASSTQPTPQGAARSQ